ncbi:MAG: DUF58 domain-containing protein [Deltaproteobacteria bacterium]|nr:DUF58 domain-containing protein [Deltaproteobacteria bacterium]
MLLPLGRVMLGAGLALLAAGLVLGVPGIALAGAVAVGTLHLELRRLRRGLRLGAPPWQLSARCEIVGHGRGDPGTERSHRVGRDVPVVLQFHAPLELMRARLDIDRVWTSPGLVLRGDGAATVMLRGPGAQLRLVVCPQTAAVHRVVGVQGRLTDPNGLVQAHVFLPAPCELAVLPRSLPIDLRSVAETRRMSPRSGHGQRPDKVPGTGDDLRELREHVPGDPFKHIAWKASAARGRLMARSFERERTRSMYVVLETGATMRDGVAGRGPLDQAADLVHSLAEACARTHDPFGLALVDGRVLETRPVLEGLAALGSADRALLDIRRAVAEDLAPLDEAALFAVVTRYLLAVERAPLPVLIGTGVPHTVALTGPHVRQRVVMAALSRLPLRERIPVLRGPEPSARSDLAILRRFCRAADLPLPYRGQLPADQRVAGIVAGVRSAMTARKGPFALIVVSDFRGLSGHLGPMMTTFAHARQAGHRVMAVAVREIDESEVLDVVADAEDVDAARGLVRADHAARQQLLDELEEGCRRVGAVFQGDPNPKEIAALWRYG